MRTPRRSLIERALSLAESASRVVDIAAQLRVYRRGPDGRAEPAELLPRIYGGRYVRQLRGYTGETPAKIVEFPVHPGQLDALTYEGPEMRILALGAPGGGKTSMVVTRAIMVALDMPGVIIGMAGPTVGHNRRVLLPKTRKLLKPTGWIAEETDTEGELSITLVNGTKLLFLGSKEASRALGAAGQGLDLAFVVEDEHQAMPTSTCLEMNARGRQDDATFHIFSAATNRLHPEFQYRLANWYKSNPEGRLLRYKPQDNVFVADRWWERHRKFMSKDDYEREFGEADAKLGRIYDRFDDQHIRPLPLVGEDITRRLTEDIWGRDEKTGDGYSYVIGQDWGSRFIASVVLKAYKDPLTGRRLWWAVDEILTDGEGSDRHAQKLFQKYGRRGIVVGDPRTKTSLADAAHGSDYTVFHNAGLPVAKSSSGRKPQSLRHRFGMMNSLLLDGNGQRHLFVATDPHGYPVCKKLVESFRLYRYDEHTGEPDQKNKGVYDVSHATDACSYGLHPFEKIRGVDVVTQDPNRMDPWASST